MPLSTMQETIHKTIMTAEIVDVSDVDYSSLRLKLVFLNRNYRAKPPQ
jgi:hypothetical protein